MKRFELPRTPAQWLEAVMNAIFFLCGILAVGCVAVITIYMFLSGLPAIGKIGPLKFLFGTEWASTASEPKYGILPFVLSSIYGTLGASLIGVPVGLLTAVFLSKAAAPGVRNVVVTAVELLSGIPSVVFGLLGMQVLVPAVAKVFGKASGACLPSGIVGGALVLFRNSQPTRLRRVPYADFRLQKKIHGQSMDSSAFCLCSYSTSFPTINRLSQRYV